MVEIIGYQSGRYVEMAKRKKTRFEKFFSLNQHFRRKGGGDATRKHASVEFTLLKERIVPGEEVVYTIGSQRDLEEQFEYLRGEFAGQPELLYYHAKLIVMMRRDIKAKENYQQFSRLWSEEREFLLRNLNLRWLVSAADTFADMSSDPVERALAFNASCLVNTVKMTESERFIQALENAADDPERVEMLEERVALFDGLSVFKSGTDDTLRNMRWRLDSIAELHPVGGILKEAFMRLQDRPNVYQRFRLRHHRKNTEWW